jgi:hypothetical protein
VPFHDYILLPDHGDSDAEVVLLPDRGDTVAEVVPLPGPAMPAPAMDHEKEPPIVRHDPFASMRAAPWMNRRLSPSGRAAALLRRELEDFPAIEGRDPSRADVDAIVKRTVDTMVPIFNRERATDIAYDELEKRRAARMAEAGSALESISDFNVVKVSDDAVPGEGDPELEIARRHLNERLNQHPQDIASSPESPDYEAASRRLEELRNPRGIAPNVEPPSGTAAHEQARLQAERLSPDWVGQRVFLSNGLTIPDRYSPTGKVMAPGDDLAAVAEAGREAGDAFRALAVSSITLPVAAEYLRRALRDNVGHGGRFDHQRRRDEASPGNFVQLRQFRDISNVNVGLFCQQAGLSLHETLQISGLYAALYSSNADRSQPYALDARTREFIEVGYGIGKDGLFK